MDDIWILLCAVGSNIFHTELLCKHLVNLDCDKSVLLAVNILDLNVKLRTVEGGLTDTDLVVDAESVKNLLHHALSLIPLLCRADVLFCVGRIPL